MKCPLCDLTNQKVIYKDNDCCCIVNIEPLKEGHLMVLPIRHITDMADLGKIESQKIFALLSRMSKIISKIYKKDPIIFMNLGKYSTQPHIHFHILPSKGGLRGLFSKFEKIPHRKAASQEELERIAKKIKKLI